MFGERAMCDVATEPDLTLDAVRIQHTLELHLLHQGQFRRRAFRDVGDFFDLRSAISHCFAAAPPKILPLSSSTLFIFDPGDTKTRPQQSSSAAVVFSYATRDTVARRG